MKIILVDDEKSMLLIMKKMLSKIPNIEVVGSFQSTSEAYLYLQTNKVELAFIDINMPEESGMDFARKISSEIDNMLLVFITAYKEYALEAFDVHAFDYIVKPISQERLENTIQRAMQRHILSFPMREKSTTYKMSIYCLGSLEAKSTDAGNVQFSSSKSTELLAYLIAKKGRFVSKWSVMEDVFRGMPPYNAETYLNTTIYKLRKALEPHGMKSAVIATNESYKIELQDIYIDYLDFENRINLISGINAGNLEEVLKTETLYMGDLFGEKDYYWSLSEKEKLSEVYWSFSKKLVEYLVENNSMTRALQISKKLIHINELDEESNCLLMKIYAAQKDKLNLERQFERYKKVLRRELGVAPDVATANLYFSLKKSLK